MKRYVVLSVNSNPEYMYYLPLTVWAWRQFGWEPLVFSHGEDANRFVAIHNELDEFDPNCFLKEIPGYRSESVTQISRLYAACVIDDPEAYLMTSDIDMLPLSNYWHPDPNAITVYGHDLTGYQHMPICYIGMRAGKWREVMGLASNDFNALIKRDLDGMPNAKASADPVKRWVVDQDLITDRINQTTFQKKFVHRGTLANGYPVGRVDRSAWSLTHEELIDCHMLRDMYKTTDTGVRNYASTLRLLTRVWPNEDFSWFRDYTAKFRELV